MAGRKEAEEIIRAADRFADAAKALTSTLDRFLEYQREAEDRALEYQQQLLQQLEGRGGKDYSFAPLPQKVRLSEEEAVALALWEINEVRRLGDPRRMERLPPPTKNEVEEWERQREERRQSREDR